MKKVFLLLTVLTTLWSQSVSAQSKAFPDEESLKPLPRLSASPDAERHARVSETSSPKGHIRVSDLSLPMRMAPKAVKSVDIDKVPARAIQIDVAADDVFYNASSTDIKIDGNTIEFSNFGGRGKKITGTIDPATGTVTIPRQSGYESAAYGNCDLVAYDPATNTYYSEAPIQGTIDGGNLTIGPWVLLITSGQYKDYILGSAVIASSFKTPNGTMATVMISNEEGGADTTERFQVYCEQVASNQIDVYNFLGQGYKWQIRINGDKTLSILPQFLFTNSEYGSFYYYKYDIADKLIYFYAPIPGTAVDRKLSWGGTIVNTSNGKAYIAKYRSSEITLDFDISYPTAQTQPGFKGNGTERDPYLIETLADLMALSDSVNFITSIPAGAKYAKAFEGKHFKQTKAINAKGVLFPPIGGTDGIFRFAGTYNGDKKTISNLTVNTGSRGYAGLFGCADTVAVIRNVTMSAPTVQSAGYYYTGCVAAESLGLMENCTVTNGTVSGTLVVGGVAGSAGPTHNCSFTGTIIGESQVGGVMAVTRDSCSFLSATSTTITLTGRQEQTQVGGVSGTLTYHRGGAITDSYFSGKIILTRSTQFAGGIVGAVTNASVIRCFSLAEIVSAVNSGSAMGGIVGGAIATTVRDCYFAGENMVSGSNSGGIIGYMMNAPGVGYPDHSTLTNCYISGMVNPTLGRDYNPYVGNYDTRAGGEAPVLENCWYDDQMLPTLKVKTGARPSADFTGANPNLPGFSDKVWTFTKGQYPALQSIAKNASAYVSVAAITFDNERENVETISKNFYGSTANSIKWWVRQNGVNVTDGNGLVVTQSSGEFALNGSFATDTIAAVNGTISKFFYVKLAPDNLFEGDGSAENPYKISNKADLIKLSDATANKKLAFNGTHFLITNDIDLEKSEDFKGIGVAASNGNTYGFGGVLDGGNHYIHNIKMVYCGVDETGAITAEGKKNSYAGFVNTLKTIGTVKNVRIASDCEFVFYSRCAAVVGYNFGGVIENCRNYADVTLYSGTGAGITSYNGTSKGSTAVVRDCYNAGRIITGYQYVGGVVSNNYGLIENCQNTGEICAKILSTNYAENKLNTSGGIAHTSFGMVRNVLNTGHVTSGKYVGGILSWFNNKGGDIMDAALNIGMLDYKAYEEGTIGNLVGKMYQEGTITNSYYDCQLSAELAAHGKDHEGSFGLKTAELTSGKEIEGLDTLYWSFAKGRYPMLKTFADEPGAIAGAESVVFFGDNINRDSISSDCDLNVTAGLEWKLTSSADAFSIRDNSILWMDPAPVLTDTLSAVYKGFTKVIPITATPDSVPLPTISIGDDNTSVRFSCAMEGVSYRYTLDGTIPGNEAAVTDGSVALSKGKNDVVVIAFRHNCYPSQPVSMTVINTGLSDIMAGKDVEHRFYITPEGYISATPVSGVNIVVTVYTDGTETREKSIIK